MPFIRHLGHKPRQELTLHHCAAALLRPEQIYSKALGCFTACVTNPERHAVTLFLLGRHTFNTVGYRNRLFTHRTVKVLTF